MNVSLSWHELNARLGGRRNVALVLAAIVAVVIAITVSLLSGGSTNSGGPPIASPATSSATPSPSWSCPTRTELGIAAGGDLPSLSDQQIRSNLDRWGQQLCPEVRLDASWRQIQPVQSGTFDWTSYDRVLNVIAGYNATQPPIRRFAIVSSVAYAPTWAAESGLDCLAVLCAPSADHVLDYGRFFAAVDQHLAVRRIHYLLEIWNEENIADRFLPGVNPQRYAQMLVAVHQFAGDIPNIFGGLGPADNVDGNARPITFLQEVTTALGPNRHVFNGMAVHPYDGWGPTNEIHDFVLAHYGNLSFFATEIGAKGRGQADRLRQLLSEGAGYDWVAMILVYSPPSDDQGYSLWQADGTPKPGMLEAYQSQLHATEQSLG